jgi:predicted PurR-regulated permease PerM
MHEAGLEVPSGDTIIADRDEPQASQEEAIRHGIRYGIFAVLLTLATLWFLGKEHNLVSYLILSGLLALALEPAVKWLHEQHGWRRGSATGLLLVGVLLGVVVLGVGAGAVLARETGQVIQQLPSYIDHLNAFTQAHFNTRVVSASQRAAAADALSHILNFVKQHQSDILGGVASGLSAIFSLFTVAMFTFYLTAQGPQVRRALCSRMRPERQQRYLFAVEAALEKMGGYLYSRLLLAAINGTLMFVTLKLLGVPFALPLALISALISEFIPIVGTYLGGALPVLVALAEQGPTAAIVVLIEILLYQLLENSVLSPRISAKTIELNPGLAFGAAMAGGAIGGFVGAFFALPITATIQTFMSTYAKGYAVTDSALTHLDAPAPAAPPNSDRRRRRHRAEPETAGTPAPNPRESEHG